MQEKKDKAAEILTDQQDGASNNVIAKAKAELKAIEAQIAALHTQLEQSGCFIKQPQYILQIQYQNPDHVVGFNSSEIVWGGSDPTPVIGGTFPSVDAQQEWKQVLEPHEEDHEGPDNMVGATGWALNPDFSGADVPFTHPFGFDWEFMIALDQPHDDPTKYTFLLARGNQSQQAEGTGAAVEQATAMSIPLPVGPDNFPSVLGVEIDPLVIPAGFTDPLQGGLDRGDRVAVFGRWIVDCGHEVEVADVKSYRSEIHPPLLMASARVTEGSLVNSQGKEFTRVLFASRAYLVSQRFTTETDDIYKDSLADDGPLLDHFRNEIVKVANPIFPLSTQVEAHAKIKSYPFVGKHEAHFIVKPPAPSNPFINPGRLRVSYQFTVRSGCSVKVTPGAQGAIDVVITLDKDGYTPPPLWPRVDHPWPRSELKKLDPNADTAYLAVEVLSALLSSGLQRIVIEAIFERGIVADDYTQHPIQVELYDASRACSVFIEDLPTTTGVTTDDSVRQPFPVYGWLEVGYEPLTTHF
jgi:hypothetical protein